jgi:hypothetical protein
VHLHALAVAGAAHGLAVQRPYPGSWAYSAIATNDRGPVRTGHALTSNTASTPWPTPRAERGSRDPSQRLEQSRWPAPRHGQRLPLRGSCPTGSGQQQSGEDDNAGTAS